MVDLSDVESIRKSLAQLCRNKNLRITGRNFDVANYWEPYRVKDPDTHMYFTDDGAWDFIADALESGAKLRCIKPTTEFPDYAYYIIEQIDEKTEVYMKVMLKQKLGKVVGVSFHYGEKNP